MYNLQPLPNYSLADLFRDINNGVANEFTYNNKTFNVKRYGFNWVITDPVSGLTASTKYYVGSMTDLQGMAACIAYYNRSIAFDRDGNIIN